MAMAPDRAAQPTNPLPFSRGNSAERVDMPGSAPPQVTRNEAPADPGPPTPPAPQAGENGENGRNGAALPLPGGGTQPSSRRALGPGAPGTPGALSESLRNIQRYIQGETFENAGGGGGQYGPAIQFDTKGVEFGPWLRRFVAQIKRNWFIPYAAMAMKGHVVITFNVHKSGAITDLTVAGPSGVDAFNNAAFNALAASNPTQPLPPEYPSEKAFFTVTFFYNEVPPQ
jgi:TonB family protein